MTVSTDRFGKDHWSLLAYVECCAVDNKGVLDNRRMRCDIDRHPGLAHSGSGKKYPTILVGGAELPNHDDWDCLDDLGDARFVGVGGTGIAPVVRFTDLGYKVAAALRQHMAQGNHSRDFRWENTDA